MDTPEKDITTSDLAIMIGKGFEHVSQRFDAVEHRLDNLEKGVDALTRGQETLFEIVKDFSPKHLKKLEGAVDDYGRRLKKLETKPA